MFLSARCINSYLINNRQKPLELYYNTRIINHLTMEILLASGRVKQLVNGSNLLVNQGLQVL